MNKQSEITIDRLSQLPKPILHHILSLLSQKEATRTCVLSKSWRYLWHGRFNVEFRDRDHGYTRNKRFWSFVDKTLQRYLDQNLSLQQFFVDIRFEVDFELLQKWIPIIIMNMDIRSLNLIFYSCTKFFPLPSVVFQSESLVELHLRGCDFSTLKSTDNVMLYNLQTLRLYGVDITDEIFENIISSCPLIENLNLSWCTGLKTIKLLRKHCNIKNFACITFNEIIVEIENPQILESVHIQKCRDWFFRHRNTHFPHLKSLNLQSVQLPETLDNFSSFFPCLNELILDKCDGLKEFRLLSSSITRLTIKIYSINKGKRIKAFIDTPNIRYFEYSGQGFLPSIKFTTTSKEWKSQITLCYKLEPSDNDVTLWFLKLKNLLKALSQSHITLKLLPIEYTKLHINDSYGDFYKPVVVEHLKLWGCYSYYFDPAILNCFFRIFRPRYIQMENGLAEFNLAECISKLIPDESGCYFWLHDLDEVNIEVWDMKEWHCIEGTSIPYSQQQSCFRLTWKEQLSKFT